MPNRRGLHAISSLHEAEAAAGTVLALRVKYQPQIDFVQAILHNFYAYHFSHAKSGSWQRFLGKPNKPLTFFRSDSGWGKMIVLIDEREIVIDSYKSQLKREGFVSVGFNSSDFKEWADTSQDVDLGAIGACLVSADNSRNLSPRYLRQKTDAPVIALVDSGSLESTLNLFETGYDDVLSKPIHVREILARITAIKRRGSPSGKVTTLDRLTVFADGRDPEIDGSVFPLPRRERRILEYLASVNGRRVSKTQIFNAIYGVFDEDVDENVVESHISKLRKKLKQQLGFDVIDSKRFLGYRLVSGPQLANYCG